MQLKRLLAFASFLALGCGQRAGMEHPTPQPGPDRVVAEFLEAIRVGDDDKAASLLTSLAQKKTTEMELVVAPPGSETARFQLQGTQVAGQTAHVTADWTDLDTDGRVHTDRIVWILRNGAEGWRISGMASQIFADRKPIVLNFEDPADMLRKQQEAEEELARREQRSQSKATDGFGGASAIRY